MTADGPEIRIGDREREMVASVLRDAVAEGRLTAEEFDERVEQALRARTFSDLDPLVVDLPVEPPSSALGRGRPGTAVRATTSPGSAQQDPLVLDAGWSSVARTGRWEVPPFIELNASFGTVKLDCLLASAPEVVDVRVIGSAGYTVIVVPAGWGADVDRLRSSWGSASSKVSSTAEPGGTLLVLHGSVGAGTLTIRHAGWFDRRKLEKQGLDPDRPQLPR